MMIWNMYLLSDMAILGWLYVLNFRAGRGAGFWKFWIGGSQKTRRFKSMLERDCFLGLQASIHLLFICCVVIRVLFQIWGELGFWEYIEDPRYDEVQFKKHKNKPFKSLQRDFKNINYQVPKNEWMCSLSNSFPQPAVNPTAQNVCQCVLCFLFGIFSV